MKNVQTILRFLLDAMARGERTALVTITDVIGRSSRGPGTHMAVSETGAFVGSLSGGCVEAAVVGEALRVMATGQAEMIRFGAGSRFIDIRLPCGGAIDFMITPEPSETVVRAALRRLEARVPIAIGLASDGGIVLDPDDGEECRFVAYHWPDLRLFVIGHGAETGALARLAVAFGADVIVLSPDAAIVDAVRVDGATSWLLKTPSPSPHLAADPYSAVVALFHDHDWETELLAQALDQTPFYIGAMGSRATHARRLEALRWIGVSERRLEAIVGPVGIIPGVRDPDMLALSVLSEIAARYDALPGSVPADGIDAPFMKNDDDVMRIGASIR